MRIPLAPEGYPFIAIAIAITVVLWFVDLKIGFYQLFYPAISLTLFVVWFFRDPEREIPGGEGILVSPADGKVIKAGLETDDRFLNGEVKRVSIFMNVFNVHVNRMPGTGRIKDIRYNPGKFFNASLDKASLLNEQNALFIECDKGVYVVNQIAGLIARRIVCRVKPGDTLERGERFGLIRFGSRLDLYFPPDAELKVKIGEKVQAGSSVVAIWK